jgi:hypothetical protein
MPVPGLAVLAPEPHRTTRQPAVNRSTEPAIGRGRAGGPAMCVLTGDLRVVLARLIDRLA